MRRFLNRPQLIPDPVLFKSLDFDETNDDRVAHKTGNVVNVEPFHQLRAVCFNGFDTDHQRLRDLFGSAAFGDQTENFSLARAQRF